MKKIKIFEDYDHAVLETNVNKFLAEHPNVIDIRIVGFDRSYTRYGIFIIYEEEESKAADIGDNWRKHFEDKINSFIKEFEAGEVL